MFLDMLPELCSELEDRMRMNVFRNVIMAFFLIANMNETVIHSHLGFSRRLIFAPLIFVKFFETLKGYRIPVKPYFAKLPVSPTIHQLLLFKRNGELRIISL